MTVVNLGVGGGGFIPVFGGDTGSGGTQGLVPAPPAGSGAAGWVLKASGSWGEGGGSGTAGWQLTGNGSLVSGSFLGTTDAAQPLVFKTNNATFMTVTSGQVMTLNPASLAITCATVTMPSLASGTAADVLYYNAGVITKGAAPSGGSGWGLSGNTLAGSDSVLGSINPEPWAAIYNNLRYVSFAFDYLTLDAPGIHIDVSSPATLPLNMGTVNARDIYISNALASTTLDGTTLIVPNLPTAVTSRAVYWDSTSHQFSVGTPGGSGSSWAINASNTGSGNRIGQSDSNTWKLSSNGADVASISPALFTSLAAFNHGSDAAPAGEFALYCGNNSTNRWSADLGTSHIILDSVDLRLNANATSPAERLTKIGLALEGNVTSLQSAALYMPNIPDGTTSEVIYVGVGGVITKGAIPGGSGWSLIGNSGVVGGKIGTLDAQAFSVVYNNTNYISLASTLMSMSAPAISLTASVGEFTINGSSLGNVNINSFVFWIEIVDWKIVL